MKDPRNVTIWLLVICAAILAAMLARTYVNTQQVARADTPARAGQYIAVTGAFSSARDLLYVVDVLADQLNVYVVNVNTNSVDLLQAVDLKRWFAAKGAR